MDRPTEKLELGLERLAKAGGDPDLLGLALQSIHGALEDFFRAKLAADDHLPPEQRAAVLDPKRVQWKELLDTMQLHGNLSAADREHIWRANAQRTRVAHGGRYNGTRADLERYAGLVKQLCGYSALAKPAKPPAQAPAKPARPAAEKSAPRSTLTDAPDIPRAVRARPRASPPRSRLGWLSLLLVVAVLASLALFVVLRRASRPLAQLAAAPATTSALTAAADPPGLPTAERPTSSAPRAAIVNAPEGLNLRRDHSSQATILGALPSGARVTVIDGPIVAEGRSWWKVAANDQQGWCAGEFLTFDDTT